MHLQIIVGDRCPRTLRVATQQSMWGEALRDDVLSNYFANMPSEAELPILKPMEAFGGPFVQLTGTLKLDIAVCKEWYRGNLHLAQECAEAIRQIFGESLGVGETIELHVSLDIIMYDHGRQVDRFVDPYTSII